MTQSETPQAPSRATRSMSALVLELVKPYGKWLAIVLAAMLIETAMSLAAPWPLKVVIDNVVGTHPLPEWLHWVRDLPGGTTQQGLALWAGISLVLIALVGGIAAYIDNYYTESVGQWVANDLRKRVYHHPERLSLSYYDTHQTGTMLSTITGDVGTIQDFASSATLTIIVDMLTIVGVLGVMLWLDWDFALVAISVTPFLLWFVARFKKAVKKATHEVRNNQSDLVGVVSQLGVSTSDAQSMISSVSPAKLLELAGAVSNAVLGAASAFFFVLAYIVFMAADAGGFGGLVHRFADSKAGLIEVFNRYSQAVRDAQLSTYAKDLVMGGLVIAIGGYLAWFFLIRKP